MTGIAALQQRQSAVTEPLDGEVQILAPDETLLVRVRPRRCLRASPRPSLGFGCGRAALGPDGRVETKRGLVTPGGRWDDQGPLRWGSRSEIPNQVLERGSQRVREALRGDDRRSVPPQFDLA